MASKKLIGAVGICMAIAVAGVGATPASATTICVAGTSHTAACSNASMGPGGRMTLTSTDTTLRLGPGSVPAIVCSHSTLTGTAPATTATTVSTPSTLRYGGCTMNGGWDATVFPGSACNPGGSAPITFALNVHGGSPFSVLTVPAGCTITANAPGLFCTMKIVGPQTIGNGTIGAGGQSWINGTASTVSRDTINNDTLTVTSSGGVLGCLGGTLRSTLSGTSTVTTPATLPDVLVE
jgi:hypothetical protein